MLQIAVFVDAGYLYAQGSSLLSGQKQPRQTIQLATQDTLTALHTIAEQVAPGARMLRVYWYDGLLRGGRPTTDQLAIANSPRTKLRLGMINGSGQQKGVDSLIVTDLIDLARNKAITDALLVAGDEDLRIGVQIAQTFGVQTHLLGIKPARGSQSPDLIQESDTHHEWDETTISRLMTVTLGAAPADSEVDAKQSAGDEDQQPKEYSVELVHQEIEITINSLSPEALEQILSAFSMAPTTVPLELDRPTLGRLGSKVSRRLEQSEVRDYRKIFCDRLRSACEK